MTKTADPKQVALPKPKVGMKLWAKNDAYGTKLIPAKFVGESGKIVSISADGLFVELEFETKPDDKMNKCLFSFLNTEMTIEDFWDIFYLKQDQGNCFDPDNIWIAGDGDGGYYSYDSEEAASDYCYMQDEEGPYPVGRSYIEAKAAEMFVLLRHLSKDESSKEIRRRIKKVVADIEANQNGLDEYIASATKK